MDGKKKDESMNKFAKLFSATKIAKVEIKNRITMAPLFLGMAEIDGTAGDLIVDHYREMGASGVGMVVIENAAVDPSGMGTVKMLRADSDDFLPGLKKLAEAINSGGAKAFQQINHTGRYSYHAERWGPSLIKYDYVTVREMPRDEIARTVQAYASAARRIRQAGFDGVEIHGGTGYLIVQFLSNRTNHRTDEYGGSLENRMRFPLEVVEAVRKAVGEDFPVGYRFQADELLPDGLHLEETLKYARELELRGVAYLSVMAGNYDSFFLPEYIEEEKKEGYQVRFAAEVKKVVSPKVPVITAGRIQKPEMAEEIIATGKADLIGLARVLLADPLWPRKVSGEIAEPVNQCEAGCMFCWKRVMKAKISYCIRWPKARREAFQARIGEKPK